MIIAKEYIASVDPKVHEKYSPNFHKFLSRLPNYLKEKGLEFYIRQYKADGEKESGRVTLGYIGDNGAHTEASLVSLLCARVMPRDTGSLLGTIYDQDKDYTWTPFPELWTDYMRCGRCAFDPHHNRSFSNNANRWDFKDTDHRTCNWCGLQQVHKKIRRVVYDSVWCNQKFKK